MKSTKSVELGRWQKVSFTRDGKKGTLNFEGEITASSQNYFAKTLKRSRRNLSLKGELLDVQEEVFLGEWQSGQD